MVEQSPTLTCTSFLACSELIEGVASNTCATLYDLCLLSFLRMKECVSELSLSLFISSIQQSLLTWNKEGTAKENEGSLGKRTLI
jgi:hypothetical protein